MMDLKFSEFDMRDPEKGKSAIRRYLNDKGLAQFKAQLAIDHHDFALQLLQEMEQLIYAAWTHGYSDGEIDAGRQWDEYDDTDEL